eukprot:Tbor_TRINITY_DN3778_c0_g1::TRINITY_DN3778_c0_g1_i1::g.2479::m.2479/K04371/MAPK1_3; mitogen-activated protein kinase 1/3
MSLLIKPGDRNGASVRANPSNIISLSSSINGRKVYRVRGTTFDVEDRYTISSIVGHGAYGVVCAAVDHITGKEVAIKRIGRIFDDLIDGRRIWREVRILRLLRDASARNVLKLQRLFQPTNTITTFRELYVVTDLLQRDLHSLIRQKRDMSVDSLRKIGVQILRCLADMHSLGIIHRDIKPSNILLDNSEAVCVCDFGLARGGIIDFNEALDMTDYVVTRWYRPPELLAMCKYNVSVDLWAVGCVLAEFALQRPLFPGHDYLHQFYLVVSTIPVTSTEFMSSKSGVPFINELAKKSKDAKPIHKLLTMLPSDGVDLITKLLAFDPNNRISAKEALKHPFFSSVGGDDQTVYPKAPDFDWSFDMTCEVSEAQLRRNIWNEIEYSNPQQ